jgi:hypothetical protein
LQRTTRTTFECGVIASTVCHSYCGRLNTRPSDDRLLVAGRRDTRFSWWEGILAGVAKKMPYNAERTMKDRDTCYWKMLLPIVPNAIVDIRLVTEQNLQLAEAAAKRMAGLL